MSNAAEKRHAFITGSYQQVEPLLPLLNDVLATHNIQGQTFASVPLNAGVRWTEILKKAIAEADILIVIAPNEPNKNVMFELGLATALNIPILILGESTEFGNSDLAHIPQLTVPLNDTLAVKFQLDMALSNLDLLKRQVSFVSGIPYDRKPRMTSRDASRQPTTEFENYIWRALDYAPEIQTFSYEPQLESADRFRPDFAAWIDFQDVLFSGPLIIEVKQLKSKLSQNSIAQVSAYVASLGNAAGIIIADTPDNFSFEIHTLNPLIYIAGPDEFVSLLAKAELLQTMRSLRNRLAHGS